jgi:hypothetical protein
VRVRVCVRVCVCACVCACVCVCVCVCVCCGDMQGAHTFAIRYIGRLHGAHEPEWEAELAQVCLSLMQIQCEGFLLEDFYCTQYRIGYFSLITVGSGFHCLRSFVLFLF